MRKINKIIIHCSATRPDMDIGVAEIRDWHVNGNGWDDVGYHYIIRRDGTLESGRSEDVTGAHTYGHNHHSIGVCLVGGSPSVAGGVECNFTLKQWRQLEKIVYGLKQKYPNAEVLGHNNFTSLKTCPTFDVKEWWGGR